tara:strand:+ start:334 stop:603 length:270 start_codon:yes stop_codon:yes gene_type:complete
MTPSNRRQTEAFLSNNCTAPIAMDIKNLFKTKNPTLDVERKSIESLKVYAKQRFQDMKKERDVQHQICMMHYWDGYINAITEILNMEGQ